MRPFAIGLSAALAVAILIPAAVISAPKEEKGKPAAIDAKSREAGMKEAPAVVQAAGLGCTVTDARYMGEGDAPPPPAAPGQDPKAKSKAKPEKVRYYEVACSEGVGFALIANKQSPVQAYNCIEASQAGADGKRGNLACILPANAKPASEQLAAFVKKTGVTCEPENVRAIGSGAKNSFFEVACKGGSGYVLETANPININGDVVANNCLLYPEENNISCKLTNRQTQLALVDGLNTAAANSCAIKDRRYVLSTKTDSYYEVACQDGKGYMYQQASANGAFVKSIPCAQASYIDKGCTMTDSLAAQTEQKGLYTKLAAKAGFPCDVEKYGMLPSKDPKQEVVELKCAGSDTGGIGFFTPTSGTVYDCLTAEFNGYRCSFTKYDSQFARLSQDLVGFNKGSCKVSAVRVMGVTQTLGYVEVACADGLPGWVLTYPVGVVKPPAKEFLSCVQAKGVGGGCTLPTNKTKS